MSLIFSTKTSSSTKYKNYTEMRGNKTTGATIFVYPTVKYINPCNMNPFFSFDLFMVYIPESKQQLRTMK
jgi:hypothetical protein